MDALLSDRTKIGSWTSQLLYSLWFSDSERQSLLDLSIDSAASLYVLIDYVTCVNFVIRFTVVYHCPLSYQATQYKEKNHRYKLWNWLKLSTSILIWSISKRFCKTGILILTLASHYTVSPIKTRPVIRRRKQECPGQELRSLG